MKNISAISKTFVVLSLIAGSIWIGSYLTRLFAVYQLFEGPDLIIKSYINENNRDGILFSLLPIFVVHFVAFIITIITSLLFLLTSKLKLRYNGWLFIIVVAMIITLPFEVYLMLIDYKIIIALNNGSFDGINMISLLRDRIKDLSSFSIVALLTYVSFFYFIVFQPLTKNTSEK
jgi:hypothetical protein